MITVLAVDQDANDIITYQLVNSTSNGTEYFYLDRDTGAITLRRSLQGTFINAYTVRRQEKQSALYILCKNELQHTECSDLNIILQLTVRATDNRIRSALATVRIFITRQINQPPVFVNTPYETTIESSRQINSTVYTVTAVDSDLQVCCLSKLCTLFIKWFHRNQINYVTFGLKKISFYKCVFYQGTIRYEVIGYFPATDYFTLNSFNGRISLIRSVSNDQYSSLLYVVRYQTVIEPRVNQS